MLKNKWSLLSVVFLTWLFGKPLINWLAGHALYLLDDSFRRLVDGKRYGPDEQLAAGETVTYCLKRG